LIKQVLTTKIDESTGEVVSESSKQYQYKIWVDGKGARIKTRNYHCTLYQDAKLSDVIEDKNDLLRTFILIEHIYKDTNVVYIQKSARVWRPASANDISIILDFSPRRTKEYLKRMIAIGVIAELTIDIKGTKYVSYVFNPVFANSCRYIDNTLYLLFKPYVDKHCPDWVKKKYNELNEEYNKHVDETYDVDIFSYYGYDDDDYND
jgi:hypothetical protein